MPRGRLAEALLAITNLLRQSAQEQGPPVHTAGGLDAGVRVRLPGMVSESEEEGRGGHGGGGSSEGEDSYTTASTSVGGEPLPWGGEEEYESQGEPEQHASEEASRE